MLCHLLGRAIVLVRDDQLSLAIGRRGQNVRLASKLVGWDIEIMTAEELDEVIEKAVKAFEKIDAVDTELAERLVEQGILSFDDLSVMEITDLVNTIEGLTEEQAIEIVSRAETLAEEQTEELPRRKGARPQVEEPRRGRIGPRGRGPTGPEDGEDGAAALAAATASSSTPMASPSTPTTERREDGQDPEDAACRKELADALAEEAGSASPTEPSTGRGRVTTDDAADPERDEASDEDIHDLALAAEKSGLSTHGHEVTFPPSDDDQGETIRIVTEAVELGETGAPGPRVPRRARGAGRPAASSPRPRRPADHPEGPAGDAP